MWLCTILWLCLPPLRLMVACAAPLLPRPEQAFVKATGEGLGFDLRQAEFRIEGSTASVAVRGVPQPRWRLHLHELGADHWASVARAPPDAVVDAWGVSGSRAACRCLCRWLLCFC